MDILRWLARCAARLRWPTASGHTQHDDQRNRRLAARSLNTRLSAHLRRDVGTDDG